MIVASGLAGRRETRDSCRTERRLMKYILAVDQSTSATKALLFDTTGTVVAATSISHRQHCPQPGWVEHDAEEIYRNTIDAIGSVLEKQGACADGLLCLSIANQRETFVVFDRATGRPLHNAIVWQCRRGSELCNELIEGGYGAEIRRITGLHIDTYFSASKMKWLLDSRPDIRRAVASGEAIIGTMDAYLIFRLTGCTVFASDHTNASRTLLYDIRNLRWSERLCDMFGVPAHSLPEVRESSAEYGETTVDGLLEESIPVCGVMGDQQAALLAQRCFSPGAAKVTFGTGAFILLNAGHQFQLGEQGILTTVAWVHRGETTYAFEGSIKCAGATISWLEDQVGLIDDPTASEKLATAIPDNEGVYLVPAFAGLGAPYWKQDARAAIVGLTLHSNRHHIARAALESIAYQTRDVLDVMAGSGRVPLELIRAGGGIVQNAFLMQFAADITGLRVRASTLQELTALGAAMASALGMGVYGSLEDLDQMRHQFVDYSPSMAPEVVERNYSGWQAAVKRVL